MFAQTTSNPGIADNEVLDEWAIPFGDWIDQAVDWTKNDLGGLLDAMKKPFEFLIQLLVDDFLIPLPWIVVVIFFIILGTLLRGPAIGLFSGGALTVCGLLGTEYWVQTARTLGFVLVAVILCVIIGVPIGVACGRVDGFWQVVRPILDAMQVVHSFVYMLPFIYFFGIGEVSATMVTMVFALPPLIRLTNLGIRQVPEDVVEAGRAFGAKESRILTDIQLPLARPAIMTGINQTLLLSISMLGIAAIMGAGGLGALLFRALSNQDPALAASAGLAFFLVAVVLDRISQRDENAGENLLSRINTAWRNTKTPEVLLENAEAAAKAKEEAPKAADRYVALTGKERNSFMIAGAGGLLTIISLFLTWNSDGGWMSSFSRRLDELGETTAGSLAGQGFNGWSASGGSWFGFVLFGLAAITVASVAQTLWRSGEGPRWFAPDGAMLASVAGLVMMLSYLVASPSLAAVAGRGIGPIVALVGTIVMVAGSAMWMLAAHHEPLRPLPEKPLVGPIIMSAIAIGFLVAAGFSGWTFDKRTDAVISPEIQAQIDELTAEARETTDQKVALANANQITVLTAQARATDTIVRDGFTSNGSRFGLWTLIAGIASLGAAVMASGYVNQDEKKRWIAGTIGAALGAGIMATTAGWIGTLARATDPNIVTGIGAFIAFSAGFFIFASSRGMVADFRRTRLYDDTEAN